MNHNFRKNLYSKRNDKEVNFLSGFTMTELSIVILIIAAIVSMVLYGKDKVENAKTLSVIRDINNFKSAIESFKFKYSEIPGDFRSASSYWSSCVDSGGNTCNGDGDGIIEESNNENGRSWQHMGLAKVIDGNFEGNVINGTTVIGSYLPKSNIDNAGYDLLTKSNANESFNMAITLARVGDSGLTKGAIGSISAYNIDKKIDDGVAWDGHVFASGEVSGNPPLVISTCLSGGISPDYDLDEELTNKSGFNTKLCLLHFAIKL